VLKTPSDKHSVAGRRKPHRGRDCARQRSAAL